MANFPIAVIIASLRRNFFNEGTGDAAETEPLFCASPVTGRHEVIEDLAAFQTEMLGWQRMRGIRWRGNLN